MSRLPEAERALFSQAAMTASPAAAAAAAAPVCGGTGHDGRVMRLLLAWKALPAFRATHKDTDAQADLPAERRPLPRGASFLPL